MSRFFLALCFALVLGACTPPLAEQDAGVFASDNATQPFQDGGGVQHDVDAPPTDDGGPDVGDSNGSTYGDASSNDWGSFSSMDAGCWADASSSMLADASQQALPDSGVDAASEDAAWAWFQLSSDDSTSMATAQILKQDNAWHPFALKPHEVLNYYDPPAELRAEEALPKSWTTPEGIYIGIDAEQLLPAPVSASDPLNDWPDAGVADIDPEQEITGADLQLLVHVFAPIVPAEQRRPWNLHLCVDVSGSMAGEKIAYVRQALQLLVDGMQPGDRLSLTTFESVGHVIFTSLDVATEEVRIRNAITSLEDQGSTNMIEGLELTYAEAQRSYDPASINRVLLFSDGDANVGDISIEAFSALTRINNQEGIYLSGVGVGSDYAIERMDALTDAGKGAHVFLPNSDEVGILFGRMLRKLVEVSADEVAIEISLPPSFAIEQFSGEEVSTNPNTRVPNVVLAAGDDMTLLARFHSDDLDAFDQDMILTLRYRLLASAEQQVFEQRFSIAELLGSASALMQRTRLVDDYARWACGQGDNVDSVVLLEAVQSFTPADPGLIEIAQQIDRLD